MTHRLRAGLCLALVIAGCRGGTPPGDEAIVALEATALREEIATGRLSALEVTQAFLRRIEAIDDAGPELNAVLAVNPDAERIARALDEQRARGAPLGPLHGVPVLVKANIDTADSMATTAGSLALARHFARSDAEFVARLRDAGAVLLGKTNLSEWANFRSTASTSGWSSLGGQTRNPYVLDRNPCGSSSGAAVAVAARLAPLAVGTETDGSIVCPAAVNGVVGVKPTLGTVSTRGVVPIAASQDTAGPLARTAADAALLLGVLVDADSGAGADRRVDIAQLRVGVVRDHAGAGSEPAVEASFARALGWLADAGVTLVDPVAAALPPEVERAELVILLSEFRAEIASYLATVENGPKTLEELIRFNEANAARVMPHFGQELFLAARTAPALDSVEYREAVALAAAARERLARLLAEQRLDALIAEANAPAWRTDYSAGDEVGLSSSSIAAVTGYPSVAVPVSVAGELPLAVAFIGARGDEGVLLALAESVERARGPFPAPRFLPTVDRPR